MSNTSVCEFEAHPWRNRCIKCKNLKSDHKMSKDDVEKFESILGSRAKTSAMRESKCHDLYAWIPPECPQNRIDEFFSCFPENIVPQHDSPGLLNHLSRLSKQIPLLDLLEAEGQSNSDSVEERTSLKNTVNENIIFGFVKEWEEGMPQECRRCQSTFKEKELVVVSNEIPFHPVCFTCCICKEKEPLAELIHCVDTNGDVLCVRHYSEKIKKRCYACDELIYTPRFTEAADTFYHPDHLQCFDCDSKLEDGGVFEDEGQLHCTECYQKKFAKECELCGNVVSLDNLHVEFEGKCWHSECFKCNECLDALEIFEKHNDKFFCEKCYEANFVPKCCKCQTPFKEERYVDYEGNKFHIGCFCCEECQKNFSTGPFVPREDKVYCKECYLRKFGVRCCKCKYTITDDDGVMYKKPYHAHCFTCSKCSVKLGKNPFKLIGEETYCLNCFANKFCKRCHSCEKPIVLGEKDVLYSYEEFNWHSSCYICHRCSESLETRPYVIRGTTLVCKDCTDKIVAEAEQDEKTVAPGEEDGEVSSESKAPEETVEQEAPEKEIEQDVYKNCTETDKQEEEALGAPSENEVVF